MYKGRSRGKITDRAIFSTLLSVSSVSEALFDVALFIALTISCDCIEFHFTESEYRYLSKFVRFASEEVEKKVFLKILALLFDAVISSSDS